MLELQVRVQTTIWNFKVTILHTRDNMQVKPCMSEGWACRYSPHIPKRASRVEPEGCPYDEKSHIRKTNTLLYVTMVE